MPGGMFHGVLLVNSWRDGVSEPVKRAHFRPLKIQYAWKIRNIFLLWQRAFGAYFQRPKNDRCLGLQRVTLPWSVCVCVCKTLQEVPVSNRFSDGKWQLQN